MFNRAIINSGRQKPVIVFKYHAGAAVSMYSFHISGMMVIMHSFSKTRGAEHFYTFKSVVK
jgi:hypothetical protein